MEHITLYHKDNLETPISLERDHFYEQRRTTYADYYLSVVDVLLFNSYGEIMLQKRSRRKKKNPGVLHTTIGGHVNFGENPSFTLIHETFEEIGTGCYLTPDGQDFGKTLEKLTPYSDSIALLKFHKDYYRDINGFVASVGREMHIKDRVYFYFGLYNGGFKSVDRSSDGCEWFSLEDLYRIRRESPELFTDVLQSYMDEMREEIQEFVSLIKTK